MLDSERWPTSPYSVSEQQAIMRDLDRSLRFADRHRDEERLRNLIDIYLEFDHD